MPPICTLRRAHRRLPSAIDGSTAAVQHTEVYVKKPNGLTVFDFFSRPRQFTSTCFPTLRRPHTGTHIQPEKYPPCSRTIRAIIMRNVCNDILTLPAISKNLVLLLRSCVIGKTFDLTSDCYQLLDDPAQWIRVFERSRGQSVGVLCT